MHPVRSAEAGDDCTFDRSAGKVIPARKDAVDFPKAWAGRSRDRRLLRQGALDPIGAEVSPVAHFGTEPGLEFGEDLCFEIRN